MPLLIALNSGLTVLSQCIILQGAKVDNHPPSTGFCAISLWLINCGKNTVVISNHRSLPSDTELPYASMLTICLFLQWLCLPLPMVFSLQVPHGAL